MFFYIIVLGLILYLYRRWKLYERFYKQGLDGPRPIPLLDNGHLGLFKTAGQYEQQMFNKYGPTYVDYFLDNNGVIATCDVEYVRKILIKDFHCFSHRLQHDYMPIYARKAVIFVNNDWKRIRSQVTPVFSSGRLRQMFKNFKEPVQTTLDNIDEMIDKKQNDEIDTKQLMRSFALDMIANVVFSLKTNSHKKDEFSEKVSDLFDFTLPNILCLIFLPAWLIRWLKIAFIKEKTTLYFSKLASNLIEQRKEKKDVVFNDFIEMLLKSEAEGPVEKNFDEDGHIVKKLSQEEIIGQCFIFFIAGLETVSTSLSVLLYELALHQDIQDKLYEDLKRCYPEEEVAYEDINKSKYLDCVLKESLRKHTTLNRIYRQATVDYTFKKSNGEVDFKIKKGQTVGISLYNLHNNAKLYNEPHRFKPERFLTGELSGESPVFRPIPFLDGPRNCIGNRYAIYEMKALLIPLVKKFRIYATNRTEIPVRSTKTSIINLIEDVTLGFERRN